MNTTIKTRIEELEKELATLKATEPIMEKLHNIDFFENHTDKIYKTISDLFRDGFIRQNEYGEWTDTYATIYSVFAIDDEWDYLYDNFYNCVSFDKGVTSYVNNELLIPLQVLFENAEEEMIKSVATDYLKSLKAYTDEFIERIVENTYDHRYYDMESHFNTKAELLCGLEEMIKSYTLEELEELAK